MDSDWHQTAHVLLFLWSEASQIYYVFLVHQSNKIMSIRLIFLCNGRLFFSSKSERLETFLTDTNSSLGNEISYYEYHAHIRNNSISRLHFKMKSNKRYSSCVSRFQYNLKVSSYSDMLPSYKKCPMVRNIWI